MCAWPCLSGLAVDSWVDGDVCVAPGRREDHRVVGALFDLDGLADGSCDADQKMAGTKDKRQLRYAAWNLENEYDRWHFKYWLGKL